MTMSLEVCQQCPLVREVGILYLHSEMAGKALERLQKKRRIKPSALYIGGVRPLPLGKWSPLLHLTPPKQPA
jgi:hypothetical protein